MNSNEYLRSWITSETTYLDYLEGNRDESPLSPNAAAEAWVESITTARGVDPDANRPSIEQLLDR